MAAGLEFAVRSSRMEQSRLPLAASNRSMRVPIVELRSQYEALRAEIDGAIQQVLDASWYVLGEQGRRFEEEFASYLGVPHVVGVGSGTEAIHLALLALGIGAGDEVIVPANTFVATAEAVLAVGARPRFVDVRPDTLLIDADTVAPAVGPRTAAILVVHLYGQMADMPGLSALAARHGLALVEDAAQAHGARFAGRRAGGAL